jgi:hypothetical protein
MEQSGAVSPKQVLRFLMPGGNSRFTHADGYGTHDAVTARRSRLPTGNEKGACNNKASNRMCNDAHEGKIKPHRSGETCMPEYLANDARLHLRTAGGPRAGCGQAGALDAACIWAAESARADFVPLQPGFHRPGRSRRVAHSRYIVPLSPRLDASASVIADAQVLWTPHAPGPPSPRRRTSCSCCGEFIRSAGGRHEVRSDPQAAGVNDGRETCRALRRPIPGATQRPC